MRRCGCPGSVIGEKAGISIHVETGMEPGMMTWPYYRPWKFWMPQRQEIKGDEA